MQEQKINKIEKDHIAILLEDLRSDFKIFGESLTAVREKGDATFEAVGRLQNGNGVRSFFNIATHDSYFIRFYVISDKWIFGRLLTARARV